MWDGGHQCTIDIYHFIPTERSNLNLLILYSNIVYLISLNNRFKSLIDGNLTAFKCIITLLKIDLLQ